MKKWEYLVIHQKHFYSGLGQEFADKEQEWLNKKGEEGWEVFNKKTLNSDTDIYYFKREKLNNEKDTNS